MKKFFVLILFLVFSLSCIACNEEEKTKESNEKETLIEEVVEVLGVTISSKDNVRTIKENETLQLTAVVYPETISQKVTWTSSNNELATVDANGLVTALKKGNVEIVATSTVDTTVHNTFSLIIEEAEEVVINPEIITVASENDITTCKVGETITLTATVLPADANQSVSWTSSDLTIATVVKGVVTPLKVGTVTITATSRELDTVFGEIVLTFDAPEAPEISGDWQEMEYTTHEDFVTCDNGTKIKVKGVVTHTSPVKNDAVSYFIQNGEDGYYIYSQSITMPVEEGKVYEVAGYKKYYNGLSEIVDVAYCVEINENISYSVNDISKEDVSSLEGMLKYQSSLVSSGATLVSCQVNTSKAYSITIEINGIETTLRIDPAYAGDEFGKINTILLSAVAGTEFEFTGFMTAFGYGKPANQIQIVNACDLSLGEVSNDVLLKAASNALNIIGSISYSANEIELPTSIDGFADVNISWNSSSQLIDVTTGNVEHSSENEIVTLTATISLGSDEITKEFKVTVFALDNNTYETVASLDLEDALEPNSWGNSASKEGYEAAVVELGTPKNNWYLQNALIAAATNDKYNGTMAIRAKSGKSAAETGRIEIREDGEYNVVEFAAAVYGNDTSGIQIKIEYSTDGGNTWIASETIISVASYSLESYRIKLPEGVKRVAIVVVDNTGNRVNIDDIKLMK